MRHLAIRRAVLPAFFAFLSLASLGAEESRPAVPVPPFKPHLTPGEPLPDWSRLEARQEAVTRAEFDRALERLYSSGPDSLRRFLSYADVSDAEAVFYADQGKTVPRFRLRFAASKGAKKALPLSFAPSGPSPGLSAKPLDGLVVCLDPGHIGGEWAKVEERYFQVGDDAPVLEARLAILACRRAATALEAAGATVLWTKKTEEPVTRLRPDDLRQTALDLLKEGSPEQPLLLPSDLLEKKIRITAEKLFYRTEEIEARAARIAAMKPRPQLTLCVHFNAAPWGDPGHPRLVPQSRLVVFVHGQYSSDEVDYEDERYGLVAKLLEQSSSLELGVAEKVAAALEQAWHILPEEYKDWPAVRRVGTHPYLYARNLLANRAFPGPVVFVEGPYMNADDAYPRLVAGDYEGTRLIAGKEQRSLFAEYGEAIAKGVVDYVTAARGE
ncbi:hypothetical protein SAMN05444156_3179 [Verrucomicrobium sp. GAS474]|uniref:hypothetical protein n=1 Tax=Verrucomicrobium sp. GAS474 TaxID=1882831 RepID=UPI000879351E|nr:hypothetical protein [Verrucomicrobium sp. GAS474]SDU30400.1 hypothetical protein SAMN05444156_3179 [Verrucomicrobium sp. GAS474]